MAEHFFIVPSPEKAYALSGPIPALTYHVYVLFTLSQGIFYVGSGKQARLTTTVTGARNTRSKSPKDKKIRERWEEGETIGIFIVYSSNLEIEVRRVEAILIQTFNLCLVNQQGIHTPYPSYVNDERSFQDEQIKLQYLEKKKTLERVELRQKEKEKPTPHVKEGDTRPKRRRNAQPRFSKDRMIADLHRRYRPKGKGSIHNRPFDER